ncbi:hypothetical protein CASFOL_024500 [Castilleja foliolosa]|uniref:Uncharacterized protein n=1 Tax=Castilleja foliolosa TaxID=1961234 RepID=A0ABD3CQA8_9LAMI
MGPIFWADSAELGLSPCFAGPFEGSALGIAGFSPTGVGPDAGDGFFDRFTVVAQLDSSDRGREVDGLFPRRLGGDGERRLERRRVVVSRGRGDREQRARRLVIGEASVRRGTSSAVAGASGRRLTLAAAAKCKFSSSSPFSEVLPAVSAEATPPFFPWNFGLDLNQSGYPISS